MATITLEYDGRNKLMQDLIALLEKYGAKRKTVEKENDSIDAIFFFSQFICCKFT